jgi:hypothetical protein
METKFNFLAWVKNAKEVFWFITASITVLGAVGAFAVTNYKAKVERQAIADTLVKQGRTEKQILLWMQATSRQVRDVASDVGDIKAGQVVQDTAASRLRRLVTRQFAKVMTGQQVFQMYNDLEKKNLNWIPSPCDSIKIPYLGNTNQ